jgi:hypothetical protein
MEKVVGDSSSTGSRRHLRLAAGAAFVMWCAAPCWAQDALPGLATSAAQAAAQRPQMRMQVDASALPRIEAQDSGFQAPRVDLTLFPSQRSGFGAMLGMSGFSPSAGPAAAPFLQSAHPSVDIGLRFSQRVDSKQVDVMAWRRVNTEEDAYSLINQQPVYGARVEMNLSPAPKTSFLADRGFLGLQLESGARITVRRSNGHPMVYYRRTF